jgi:RimJ/RimL family protein N-acetyltransferase
VKLRLLAEMPVHAPTPSSREVHLRHVSDADLPIFFEQQCEPEAIEMAAFPPRDWDAFMAHWAKILADKSVPVRTILFNGHVAGNIVSWEQEGKRLVGYWIGNNFWGQGVATLALAEFLNVVTARPLYAYVAKRNVASIRVLEKCGFAVCADEPASCDAPSDGVEEFLFKLSPNETCKSPDG